VLNAGKRTTSLIIWSLIVLQFLLSVNQIRLQEDVKATLILALMSLLLALIFIKRQSAESNDTYRFIGDAVFMLPIIYLV
jgi:hypothetical protein